MPAEALTPAFPDWCVAGWRPLRPLQAWVTGVVGAAGA
jgi:hypothetical protein